MESEIKESSLHLHPSNSAILKFLEARSIFITGATGFVGKALIEKILRICPAIVAIYILVRPKRGCDLKTRVTHLFDDKLFDQVKTANPTASLKIIPIAGDISLPGLGLLPEDRLLLCEQVSIVVHSAATINFNGKLKQSFDLNVNGTKRVIELCKEMKNIKAMIHVSTAYANCDNSTVQEFVYPMEISAKELEIKLEEMSGEAVLAATPDIIKKKPNTYVYTKAMAETVVCDESQKLPIAIVRPSIVSSTWKEPFPGWVDTGSGIAEIPAAWGKGALRTLRVNGKNTVDLIPVDTLVNLIIAAAWEISTSENKQLRVYNCCSGGPNPVSWGESIRLANKFMANYPVSGAIWYPQLSIYESKALVTVLTIIQLYIPALIMDMISLFTGKDRKNLKRYNFYTSLCGALEFFLLNGWDFKTRNMTDLHEKLSPVDRKIFNCQIRDLHWPDYIETSQAGIRTYFLKEDESILVKSRRRVQKLYWLHRFIQAFLTCLIIPLIVCIM